MIRALVGIGMVSACSVLALPSYALTADDVACGGCVGNKDLDNKAVSGKKLKKNAVRSKQVKNKAIRKKDLHASVTAGPENVIHVARRGGDFKDPVAAMSSITDSSSTNRYLVHVGPGVYDLGAATLQMKPYVDVMGAGIDATLLRGNVEGDGDLGVVTGADNAGLSQVRVLHTGGGVTEAVAIYSQAGTFTIREVVAQVTGTVVDSAAGIFAFGNPRLTDVHVDLTSAAMQNIGIYVIGAGNVTGATAAVSGAGAANLTVLAVGGIRVHDLVATATGGSANIGVLSLNAHLSNIEAKATGGTDAKGIAINGGALVGSVARAEDASNENIGIDLDDGAFVTASQATGSGVGGATNLGIEINDSADRVTNTLVSAFNDGVPSLPAAVVDDQAPASQNCADVYVPYQAPLPGHLLPIPGGC